MNSITSDFIAQNALRCGLHSCSYCQTALVDLTPLAPPGRKDDEFELQESFASNEASLGDKTVSLYYNNRFFRNLNFSGDFVSDASASCPFFALLNRTGQEGEWVINIDTCSYQSHKSYGGTYRLRIPEGMSTCVSHPSRVHV